MDGENAAAAIDGKDGESVEIELVSLVQGGFVAKDLSREITSVTNVPFGNRLFISTKGGDGEDGGTGGDGKSGNIGLDGENATRYRDATVRRTCYLQRHPLDYQWLIIS